MKDASEYPVQFSSRVDIYMTEGAADSGMLVVQSEGEVVIRKNRPLWAIADVGFQAACKVAFESYLNSCFHSATDAEKPVPGHQLPM